MSSFGGVNKDLGRQIRVRNSGDVLGKNYASDEHPRCPAALILGNLLHFGGENGKSTAEYMIFIG